MRKLWHCIMNFRMNNIKLKKLYNLNGILLSTVVFIIFIVLVLPWVSNMMDGFGNVQSPDTLFTYSSDKLFSITHDYGYEGRRMYLIQRFTFDLIWPLVYGVFCLSLIGFAVTRFDSLMKYKYLVYVPVIAVIMDYLENLLVSLVFIMYPTESRIIAILASVSTSIKWIYVSLSMILAMVSILYIVTTIIQKKKVH